jgi:hypothetical protein
MTQRHESPAANPAHRSALDHRAINVAGHLLFGMVWLERRLASVSDQIGSPTDVFGWNEPKRCAREGVHSAAVATIRLDMNDHVATKWTRKD